VKLGGSFRIVGLLGIGFSLTMLPPVLVSLWYADDQAVHFLKAFGISFLCGGAVWLRTRREDALLRRKDGFVVVALFWTALSLIGSLPFLFGPHLVLSTRCSKPPPDSPPPAPP